jgi:hypothetical protein
VLGLPGLFEVLGPPGLFDVGGPPSLFDVLGPPDLFKLTWSRFLVFQACLRQLVRCLGSCRVV